MVASEAVPSARRWNFLFGVRALFFLVYAVTVILRVIESDRSIADGVIIAALWILPGLVYLFAIRTTLMSIAWGLVFVIGVNEWVGTDFGEQQELSAFQVYADGIIWWFVAVVGVLLDLLLSLIVAAWRRATRNSQSGTR
jgi:hypothetical protein